MNAFLPASRRLGVPPCVWLGWVLWLASAGAARAQWLTQSVPLTAGWNAVYLHVDASHDTLAHLVAADPTNPILEVWLWTPASSSLQFVQSPQQPSDTGSQWLSWVRNSSGSATLERLVGNAAYLVRVATGVTTYTWQIKGRPLPPAYEWTTTGLNFLGFPTRPLAPPSFDTFLALAPELQQNAEIFQYPGGELGADNPQRVFALRTTPVPRGRAFWVRSGPVYNRFFAPFELAGAGPAGVNFGTDVSTASLRLRNLTRSNLTVSVQLLASETPPAGQPAIAALPPLLIRGPLNATNLTYGYTHLPVETARTWTLAPTGQDGSEVEVVLGLDRASIASPAGSVLAGILRFTDALEVAQVEVAVSAQVDGRSGLWIGSAAVTQVGQYLKTYRRDSSDHPVQDTHGQYLVSSVDTNLAAVASAYALRLIVHNPDSGNAVLLQRVFVGPDASTNVVVANQESALHPARLSQARRISAVHLPWTTQNAGWAFNDRFGDGTNLTARVTLSFDDRASNPFLHSYHPDHDNLDAKFENALAQGSESYTVQREVTLTVTPPPDDFASRTAAGDTFTGGYAETIQVLGLARAGGTYDTRSFEVRGGFVLRRIASIPTLTLVP